MSPRKSMPHDAVPAPTRSTPLPVSTIPRQLRFPLLVTLSLAISSILFSVSARYTVGDLGSVSRRLDDWWEVAGLIAWRTTELGLGWWSSYDGMFFKGVDLASLTLLSHLPPLHLLATFYGIRPSTVASSLAIDIVATYVPFRLLRPLLPVHGSAAAKSTVPNRSIIDDLAIRALTTLLAASIYGTVLFASYNSWLPVHLITSFDGLRDMSAAHVSALPLLIATCLPIGYAAKEFIFTSSTGARTDSADIGAASFNPATATLAETLYHNLWGFSSRTKQVIVRTTTLVFVTSLNTWLQTFVTVEGAESYGAAGYAALWATASALTGFALLWVGDV
ncbi:MAG: hypothetical protein M1832_003179 [Thelocarpon impressellum]|nr:MAG: hypothetical protein M1832_003179 [Thelocarpon impressellum]